MCCAQSKYCPKQYSLCKGTWTDKIYYILYKNINTHARFF